MKLNLLTVCLGISLSFHVAVISGLVMLGGPARRPSAPGSDPTIIILNEATLANLVEPSPPVTPVALPKMEPVKVIEPATPLAKVEESAALEPPKPPPVEELLKPQPAQQVVPDDRAPTPTPNLTTTPAPAIIVTRPNYFKNPEPAYPAMARRRHQEGVVLLAVIVDAQGRAQSVEIKKSSGFSLLDDVARQTVRSWEFEPAHVGQLAVESAIEVPVRFKLAD